jgi:hypothetical protein
MKLLLYNTLRLVCLYRAIGSLFSHNVVIVCHLAFFIHLSGFLVLSTCHNREKESIALCSTKIVFEMCGFWSVVSGV